MSYLLRTMYHIVLYLFQDKDLKQYMDDCGNIMSMHNVKVCLLRHLKFCLETNT